MILDMTAMDGGNAENAGAIFGQHQHLLYDHVTPGYPCPNYRDVMNVDFVGNKNRRRPILKRPHKKAMDTF